MNNKDSTAASRVAYSAERCLAQGTLVSAACAAAGSSVNFILGKTYLYERVREIEIFGQPPVKETQWCAGIIRLLAERSRRDLGRDLAAACADS